MLKEAIRILTETNSPTKTITRETKTFRELLAHLGNPQNSFKSIHVTGTNGKGSVTLKSAYTLQKAGYKTGVYTSPHIFSLLQRIKVNHYFSNTIVKIHEIANKNSLSLTLFQYLTATGFLYFKDEKCDIAAIQVGLGGRYDTTNVIIPQVSVITSIAIDHERILGSTREQISSDKAGIIKEGIPVVIGPHANLQPILNEAALKKAPLISIPLQNFSSFEEENNTIVKTTMKVLKERGFKISDQQLQEGLLITQPCRMEELSANLKPKWMGNKRIFFDVGHNPNAIDRMLQFYKAKIQKPGQKLIVLFGASKEKNVFSSLKRLQEVANTIMLIQANHPRAMPVYEMTQYVGFSKYPHKFSVLDDGKIQSTLTLATAQQNHQNLIICGSFFLMRQAWGFFDPRYLNEQTIDLQEQYRIDGQIQIK